MSALGPSKLVFIDESGSDTRMTRRCGRSVRGAPCIGTVPHGYWRNNTFIAGLRCDRIDAPMRIEGAMDGDAFFAWGEQMLAPTLSAGDIVICDNLSVHKNARARAAIEACGAELRFLPAYSPDLNPIEQRWSWFFDQFCAAQRSGLRFTSCGKFQVWFAHSIGFGRGQQAVG